MTATEGPTRTASRRRQQLADEFIAALKTLKHRFTAEIPTEAREELSTITMHQCEALVHVARSGGMSMNDLARGLGVGVSSCTALTDRLNRQGLVERADDPSDRRVVRVVPTERGRVVVEQFVDGQRRGVLALLEALSEDEATTLVRLLQRMTTGDAR